MFHPLVDTTPEGDCRAVFDVADITAAPSAFCVAIVGGHKHAKHGHLESHKVGARRGIQALLGIATGLEPGLEEPRTPIG